MRIDEVELLPSTADALNTLDVFGYIGRVNLDLPRIAWMMLVLRELPEEKRFFPHGKWATIQRIEEQLQYSAKAKAAELEALK